MKKFNKKMKRGFTLLEISITVSVVLMFSGTVFLNLKTIVTKNQAKECSRSLLMIHQAVNNYCLDNNISYGTQVQMSDLTAEGYLNSQESYTCPVHNTPYQTSLTYGVMPVCSDAISGHECSTD